MEIIVLASGSKGNTTYLEIGQEKILIDCGISYRQINSRLQALGKSIEGITKIFITHEHGDHVAHLAMLAKKHDVDIYLSEGTLNNLRKDIRYTIDVRCFKTLLAEEQYHFDGFSVLPFMVYHDAYEPFGYRFFEDDKSLVYITDTGYFPLRKYHLISNADAYIIESNHEVEMLLESNRSWPLKRRILDDQGHLSNDDSAQLLMNLAGDRTRYIVLAHLSEECNLDHLALSAYQKTFLREGVDVNSYQLIIAHQHYATDIISLP